MNTVTTYGGFHSSLNDSRLISKEPVDKFKKKSSHALKQNVPWFVLKGVVFFICLSACSYQSLEFYRLYLTYPLTTSIKIINPKIFKKPAITICNKSPFQLEKFCTDHPSYCQNPYKLNEFCEEHCHFCERKNLSTLMIPKLGYYADEASWEFKDFLLESYRNFTLTKKSVFRDYFDTSHLKYLVIADPSVTFTEAGKLIRCHSKNLHLVSEDEPEILEINWNQVSMEGRKQIDFFRLKMRKEDIFFPWTGEQIYLSVHSPFVPVNPILEGNSLEIGYEYHIYVRLDEEHLQPHPYETNCSDYDTLWIKSNKTDPRSEEMCKASCFLSYSRACFQCEKPKVMIYRPENLCSDQKEWSSCLDQNATERLDDCVRNCRPACLKLKYYFSIIRIEKKDISINHRDLLTIRVYVKDTEVTVLSHKPLYGSFEVFSYVGGLMGCWLGISVWTCSDTTGKKFWTFFTHLKNSRKRSRNSFEVVPSRKKTRF